MKTYSALFITLLNAVLLFSQNQDHPKIMMSAQYASADTDMSDLLAFEKIDYFKVQFSGDDLIGKNYKLIVKEIWQGTITQTDTLINTLENQSLPEIKSDTLRFRVIAKKTSTQALETLFIFPQFRFRKTFEATTSADYSLRATGTKLKIKPGQAFCAFTYLLPYEKEGWKYWCAVESSGEKVEHWGKAFEIPHYLVFEMQFED